VCRVGTLSHSSTTQVVVISTIVIVVKNIEED
jgi:hypothetical protein